MGRFLQNVLLQAFAADVGGRDFLGIEAIDDTLHLLNQMRGSLAGVSAPHGFSCSRPPR